jgi:hypothetical protein
MQSMGKIFTNQEPRRMLKKIPKQEHSRNQRRRYPLPLPHM